LLRSQKLVCLFQELIEHGHHFFDALQNPLERH